MRKLLYVLGLTVISSVLVAQEIDLLFHPVIEGDSVKIEVLAEGDNSLELGSSNFVYSIEGGALDVSVAKSIIPDYSKESYSIWAYIHNDNFEHIFLSRTNKPKELIKVSKVLIGELKYPILDKCKPVLITWDTKKGDIRSKKKSIKKYVSFKDTTFKLVKDVSEPIVLQDEDSGLIKVDNSQGHIVNWFRDGELVSEDKSVIATQTGEYYATVSNGCETKVTKQFRVDKLTSNEVVKSQEVTKLYPNPVISQATLLIDATKISNIQKVVLVNELGQELKDLTSRVKLSETILSVNEWNIPEGVYYIKVIYQDNSEILRFVY